MSITTIGTPILQPNEVASAAAPSFTNQRLAGLGPVSFRLGHLFVRVGHGSISLWAGVREYNMIDLGGDQSPAAVRVFISYAHDGDAHVAAVRDLWIFLRQQGVDARVDLPAAELRQDWPAWMEEQVQNAEYVLVIASKAYKRRAEDGLIPKDEGRGVRYEVRLIREYFYRDQKTVLRRVLPVLLPGVPVDYIPKGSRSPRVRISARNWGLRLPGGGAGRWSMPCTNGSQQAQRRSSCMAFQVWARPRRCATSLMSLPVSAPSFRLA